MSSRYTVGYIIGSLSTESINRTLSKALIRLAPENLTLVEIPIRDLPVYNRDFDADYPPAGRALKDAIASVDAVLFVTPEYNRGIPGSLKNAIDWASRPYGTNSLTRKPSAVIGASPGKIGTALAQQNVRSALSFCNSPQMGAPEAYIQFTPGLITDDGEVTDKSTEQFLRDSSKRSASSSPLSSRYCHARADTRNKGFAAQLFEHAKDGAGSPLWLLGLNTGCAMRVRKTTC